MPTPNTASRRTRRNDITANTTITNDFNQVSSEAIKYKSPATSFFDDSASFEKACSMIVNHPGSAKTNTVDDIAFTMFMDLNKKRLSQLQVLIADSGQVLDTMESEKSKFKTYIDSLNSKINKEHITTRTSAPQQRHSIQPDTGEISRPRKRQKQQEYTPTSSTTAPSIPTDRSQSKIQQYRRSLSQLKKWFNDAMPVLVSKADDNNILQLHTLAWSAFVNDLAVNDHPALPSNRKPLNTIAMNYSKSILSPMTPRGRMITEPKIDGPAYYSALMTLMVNGFDENPWIMRNKEMIKFLHSLRSLAPSNLMQSLQKYRPGDKISGLEPMESLCQQELAKKYPHELVSLFYLEIAICKYGVSQEVDEIRKDVVRQSPTCGHIFWQLIRAQPDYASRYRVTVNYLQRLKSDRNGSKGNDALCSRNTREILLRTLQNDGIRTVLEHLLPTTSVKYLDCDTTHQLQPIDLADPAAPKHIYLDDRDMYSFWICIITFYVGGRLPRQYYTHFWPQKIGKRRLGRFTHGSMILGIDWTGLAHAPLTRKEQIFVASILLGLLKYFHRKIYITHREQNNLRYLVGIVWNLMGLINQLPDYASTIKR